MIIDHYAAYLAARDIPYSQPSPDTLQLHSPNPTLVIISPSGIVTVKDGEKIEQFPYQSVEKMHEKIEKL